MKTDVLIIGAGLTGIFLASKLSRPTLILEKSKGVGGRVATRRVEDLGMDHGAPYLFEDAELTHLLKLHQIDFSLSSSGLYVKGGMTRIAKALAEKLAITKGVRAQKLIHQSDGWQVLCDNGESYSCRDLVITAPLPQALELLAFSDIPYPLELKSITYSKAVMALIITEGGESADKSLPANIHSILSMKERGLHPQGYVIRATPSFCEDIFDQSEQVILEKLLELFVQAFNAPPLIRYSELKKWRYVVAEKSLTESYLELQPHLFLAGDAFLSKDAGGAIRSALALADKL
jgi:renalase